MVIEGKNAISSTKLFLGPFEIILGYVMLSWKQRSLKHTLPSLTLFSTPIFSLFPFPQLNGESPLSDSLMFTERHLLAGCSYVNHLNL